MIYIRYRQRCQCIYTWKSLAPETINIVNEKKTPVTACNTVSPTRRAVSPTVAPGMKASTTPPSQTGPIATQHPPKDAVTWATKRLAGTQTMMRTICTTFKCAKQSASSSLRSTRPAVSTRCRTRSLKPNLNAILSTSHKNRIAYGKLMRATMSATRDVLAQESRIVKGRTIVLKQMLNVSAPLYMSIKGIVESRKGKNIHLRI
jgi:hypothetical protein